ncbi:MAG: TonB-dependent receptor [Candidatus Omnitrophica bacterium]|nr:TonB-dependent receptor [Candidatus Omnitrophota bacterium]
MKRILVLTLITLWAVPARAELIFEHDTVVVTADRYDREAGRRGSYVTVINEEQIDASTARTVPEILEQAEGVFVSDNSTARTSTVDIRGFGDTAGRNVLVLVDGRRLNVIDSGSADLVQIPVSGIERIEVIRGSGSILYGDNATGGVVNIITKKGEEGLHGAASAYYGSYDSFGQDFQVNGAQNGLSFFFNAHHFDKRGYRQQSDEFYKNFNGRLDFEPNAAVKAGIQYGFYEDSYELPGGLNEAELETYGRRGVASSEYGNIADTEDQYLKAYLEIDPFAFEEAYFGRIIIDGTWRDRELFDTFDAFNLDTEREVKTEAFTVKYVFDGELADREVDFLLGLDKSRSSSFINSTSPFSDERLTISKDEYGVFANLDLEVLDRWFVTAGHRHHEAEYTFDQRLPGPSFTQQEPDVSVTSASLRYEYAQDSNVFFKFEQSFRFLTPNEWYNSFSQSLDTDLDQQKGHLFQAGLRHSIDDMVLLTVTPYWMETEKEIFYDPTIGSFGANSNYDEIRRVGVELGARFDLLGLLSSRDVPEQLDRLEYFMNYTYQNPEFTDGTFDGHTVPWVPEHQANMGLTARLFRHYRVSLIGRFVGSRYVINDQANTLPKAKSYAVADLKLSYERDHVEVFASVNNLFDKKYNTYEATNTSQTVRDVFPAAEKNFMAGMVFKF